VLRFPGVLRVLVYLRIGWCYLLLFVFFVCFCFGAGFSARCLCLSFLAYILIVTYVILEADNAGGIFFFFVPVFVLLIFFSLVNFSFCSS